MSDEFDHIPTKMLEGRLELVNEINRIKFKLLHIAISGLIAIKEQGHPIAEQTLIEMLGSIPKELELDVYREVQNALNPIDDE